MKQKTCCFTGHRDIPLGDYQLIFDKTEEMVERLIKKGYEFDEHSYLCWTDTPEISYVLEYSPEAVPDEEIVKMAESAETLERNK